MPQVSVCIPIYNVEKYIEQCAQSLFEQILDDIEYIFIDDASKDNSLEILQRILNKYPHRQKQTKIIRHPENRGVSATRKEAILQASGDYIIHCDPDDWVESDMYLMLYEEAIRSGSDMVYCSFSREMSNLESVTYHEPKFLHPDEMINAFFSARSHGSLWNKLYRKSIAKDESIDWPDNITMCEDMRCNIQMLRKCRSISWVSKPLYHYRENHASLSGLRNRQSLYSEMDNIMLFEKILPSGIFEANLNIYKRRILLEVCMFGFVSARQWHSLWKRAKRGMWKSNRYPWKLKTAFYCACINYTLTSFIWKKLRERHQR